MPFSFIDIEERKSKVIGLLFFFLLLFYFLTAYFILLILENTVFPGLISSENSCLARAAGPSPRGFCLPGGSHIFWAFVVAVAFGFLHWVSSTHRLVERICSSLGARPADPEDVYHQGFKNIVDEVSVAIGGRPLEAVVMASSGMNAFALEDFNRRAVIGVTEGLLSRLNRAQIEAVVAHEAGHIVSGDCLSTTVTLALAELYDEIFSRLKINMRRVRGRGAAAIFLLYAVIGLMRFLSNCLRYFISRQREYRADAVSVRLTRDPLALAEALGLISRHWRGEGAPGEKMEAIFIVNPARSALDEREGFWADLFSTHPPVRNRVGVLLDMAHLDEKALEERLENFKRVSPVASGEFREGALEAPARWFVFLDQAWQGPFSFKELEGLSGLLPETWVKGEGASVGVRHAYEVEALMKIFRRDTGTVSGSGRGLCPRCKISLAEFIYEGAPVLKCAACDGIFAQREKTQRILVRSDKEISAEAVRLGELILGAKENLILKKQAGASAWLLDCPECLQKMRRQFFVYAYPVEVDACGVCGGVWFERLEVEILQYLYERRQELFPS